MENDIYAQLVLVGGTYITKDGFTDMRNRKRSLHYVNVDTIVEVISPERVRYAYPHCQQRIPS